MICLASVTPKDLDKLEANAEINWHIFQLLGFTSLEICCKINFQDLPCGVGTSRFNFRGILYTY